MIDTHDYQILRNKLISLGMKDLKRFAYIPGRKQLVNVNGVESELLNITCGVPQGCILGHLLFLYYVNDIDFSIQSNYKLLPQAAGNTKIFSHKDTKVISQNLGRN